jgi:hypothetical protein
MQKKISKVLTFVLTLGLSFSANAGHEFTQGTGNTDIDLTGGNGIDIPQTGTVGASAAERVDIYMTDWGTGDVMCLEFPGYSRFVEYDNLPAGWTDSPVGPPGASGTGVEPAIAALGLSPPFTFRISALQGSFTLNGYVIDVGGGADASIGGADVADGQVVQSNVTSQSGCEGFRPEETTPVPMMHPVSIAILILSLMGIAWFRRFQS